MAKALGIGGAFLKSKSPEALARWYQKSLNLGEFGPSNTGSFGVPFKPAALPNSAYIQWSIMPEDTKHYRSDFMFNFVVDDIAGVISQIEENGGKILRKGFVLEGVGTFAWFLDPDGNQMELWQPV